MNYLVALTDDTGVFQHAKYCIPKRSEGYTTDDNACALVAATKYYRFKKDTKIEALANTYVSFLNHMQKPDGNFHNYLGYERSYLDVDGSEDCIGRTPWSCGHVINFNLPKGLGWLLRKLPFPGIRNKNAVVFPEKVNGRYVLLHRVEPDLCVALSDDLTKWCDMMSLMKPRADSWDNWKIGVAGTPIKLNEGWLVIYHGVRMERMYCLGVALLEKEHPEQVLYRPKDVYYLQKKIMNDLAKCLTLYSAAATLFWTINSLFIMEEPTTFYASPPFLWKKFFH